MQRNNKYKPSAKEEIFAHWVASRAVRLSIAISRSKLNSTMAPLKTIAYRNKEERTPSQMVDDLYALADRLSERLPEIDEDEEEDYIL